MLPNVVGMSQYADGGRMTTKPYTSGGTGPSCTGRLSGNARMRRAVQGLDRLADLDEVLRQERLRGDEVP
jgi:deoxyribodipyrimidine photolyase-related protein